MKKSILLLSLYFIALIPLNAQEDCYDKIAKQAVKLARLQDKDSISQEKYALLNKENEHLQGVISNLNSNIDKLREDSVKLADIEPKFKKLQQELDTLKVNTINRSAYDIKIRQLRQVQEEVQSFENETITLKRVQSRLSGNLETSMLLIRKLYEDKFDTLIKVTTIQSIESDITVLKIMDAAEEKNQKINELLLYKHAEILLREKYDRIKITNAKQSLEPIKNKGSVKLLIELLDEYESCNTNLKKTIIDIQKNNVRKAGNIEDLISDKKNSTLRIIGDYVFDNEVDLTKYTYLNQIVSELTSRKMNDVDADVKDLLLKL